MWSAASMILRLPPLLLLSLVCSCAAQGPRFQCTSSATTCQALATYVATNTTYTAISSLFQVNSIYDLYGANGINATTPPSTRVPDNTTIRVPFPCACANGVGTAVRNPIYTVRSGDNLDMIAREIFQGLVTFPQIAAANSIANAALIQPGQAFLIPLPCSCDPADGADAVHLAHKVKRGSTVAAIAREYGTREQTLLQVNNMSNPRDLLADQVLDVPLRACNSSIRSDSLDSSLRLPSGSYALTAQNCVMCTCYSAVNGPLLCEMSPDYLNLTKAPGCSIQNCRDESNPSTVVPLGRQHVTGCTFTRCDYAGYGFPNGPFISTTAFVNRSTCGSIQPPSPSPSGSPPFPDVWRPPPDSAAHLLRPGHQLRWALLVFFHAALLLLTFL